jgi:hypothetical protein
MRKIVMICFLSLMGGLNVQLALAEGGLLSNPNRVQYILIGTATTPSTFTVKSSKPTLFGKSVTISLKV